MDHGGVDGSFGASTKTAVIYFQRIYGLDDDGIVGENTWKKIGEVMGMEDHSSTTQEVYLFYGPLSSTDYVGSSKYILRVSRMTADTLYYYTSYQGTGVLASSAFRSST